MKQMFIHNNIIRKLSLPLLKVLLLALLLSWIALADIYSQVAVTSSGGDYSGQGGSASFSIGQIFYLSHSSSNGQVTEGVQVPYEIYVITSVESIGIMLTINAFPNPVQDYLNLFIDDPDVDLDLFLFSIMGNLLHRERIRSSETRIDMSKFTPGVYFLKVTRGHVEKKSFKIIKN